MPAADHASPYTGNPEQLAFWRRWPDENSSHLFSACTGPGIVRLRSEMPDVFEHPLGYLLESNNALLLKFLDAAHAILVSPGRFAFLGSIDPPAPPPGQHDDGMQFS